MRWSVTTVFSVGRWKHPPHARAGRSAITHAEATASAMKGDNVRDGRGGVCMVAP